MDVGYVLEMQPPLFSLMQDKSGYKVLVAFIYSPRHPQREPKRQHTLIANIKRNPNDKETKKGGEIKQSQK